MNMQPVTKHEYNLITVRCAHCGERASQTNGVILADLDGEPFRAYYHEACAAKLCAQED